MTFSGPEVYVLTTILLGGGIGAKPEVWHLDTKQSAHGCIELALNITQRGVLTMCSPKRTHPAFNWPTARFYSPRFPKQPIPWR